MGVWMQAGEISPWLFPSFVETSKAVCHKWVHFPSQRGHLLLTVPVNILHCLVMKYLMPRSLRRPPTHQDHEDVNEDINCSRRKQRPGEVREASQEETKLCSSQNICDERVISMEMRQPTGTVSSFIARLYWQAPALPGRGDALRPGEPVCPWGMWGRHLRNQLNGASWCSMATWPLFFFFSSKIPLRGSVRLQGSFSWLRRKSSQVKGWLLGLALPPST